MEFDPKSETVQLYLKAVYLEDSGEVAAAKELFWKAWDNAGTALEKFFGAHSLARHEPLVSERLRWFETALHFASKADPYAVASALPLLQATMAECHEALGNSERAKKLQERATLICRPTDPGPFFHGTKADLEIGDVLTAGGASNYVPGLRMNHVYFTAHLHGAGLAAALAKGDGRERVYVVEPTDVCEDDPNVTNKKFPGNPTRSYRTVAPLRIVGELGDWTKQTPEDLQRWRQRLAQTSDDIIN